MKNLQNRHDLDLGQIELSLDGTYHLYNNQPLYEKKFDCVMSFHPPGVAAVKDKSGAYHVNIEGQELYQERFLQAFGFYEGLAAISSETVWYHVDLSGQPVYEERYEWVGNYQEGRCAVRDNNGDYFHIQNNGKLAYDMKYKYAGDFKYGVACVYDKDGFAHHIDKDGNEIHSKKYLELGVYHKGFAIARDRRGAFHVNKLGEEVYPQRYKWVEPFYNGQAFVCKYDDEKLIINENGTVIHSIYDQNTKIVQENLKSKVKKMLISYWETQIIHSIVELEILDMIKIGSNTFNMLLEKSRLPSSSLKMILQVLKVWDLIKVQDDKYTLKYMGELLTENHPGTLKFTALMWGGEHYIVMGKLTDALKEYSPQFSEIYHQPIFDFLESNPRSREIFTKAMEAYSSDYDALLNSYDFSSSKVILDVGGGSPTLLEKVINNYNNFQKAILFDLPSVINNINDKETPNSNKLEYISGSFFEPLPIKADAIILSRVLHDWNDVRALKILNNVYNVLTDSGKLLIFEMVIPEDPAFDIGITLNFNLLVMTGGKERTRKEFNNLLRKAGFAIDSIIRKNSAISLIIVKKSSKNGVLG